VLAPSGSISVSEIVTNSKGSGTARVYAGAGNLTISGKISCNSVSGGALIYTSGNFVATDVSTTASLDALVTVSTNATIAGNIVTKSGLGDAHVYVNGDIIVHSISTWAQNDSTAKSARIQSFNGKIDASGILSTYSEAGEAYILAQHAIDALEIHTTGELNSRVQSISGGIGSLDLRPVISTNSKSNVANVLAPNGIYAREIKTYSGGSTGNIYSSSGRIDVLGDIITRASGDAYIYAVGSVGQGYLRATNITTEGAPGLAYIISENDYIEVSGNIKTFSNTSSGYVKSDGNLTAGSIMTKCASTSYIRAYNGNITVAGDLFAKSTSTGSAYILASGNIAGRNIRTSKLSGGSHGFVESIGGTITAIGDIETNAGTSGSGNAYVKADGNIKAGNISTIASGLGGLASTTGSIRTNGIIDVRTYGSNSAYVLASNEVEAQSIKTYAASGFDQSIKSTSGIVDAEMRNDISRAVAFSLQNADLSIPKNSILNTTLSIIGTCTLRGEGSELELGVAGQLDVTTGSTLVLQDLRIADLELTKIRCLTSDGTVWFRDCDLMLSNAYNFATGSLVFDQDVNVRGGNPFVYTSSQVSYINSKSKLLFDHGTTLSYGSALDTRLVMSAATSKLHFNGSTLHAFEDIRLMKGTIEFDNVVTFSAEAGKQIAFGDGVSSGNNSTLSFFVTSEVARHGTLVNDNV
ncbi:hypothetical protein KAU11_03365, partial [Candidatus Babeliales bacterium]|nr:hypothetical protein [Candidatus Babeliales bacterium]